MFERIQIPTLLCSTYVRNVGRKHGLPKTFFKEINLFKTFSLG